MVRSWCGRISVIEKYIFKMKLIVLSFYCLVFLRPFFLLKESMQFHISLKMKIIWMKKLFQERNRTLMKVLPENLPTICNQRHISKFFISCLTKCSLGKISSSLVYILRSPKTTKCLIFPYNLYIICNF